MNDKIPPKALSRTKAKKMKESDKKRRVRTRSAGIKKVSKLSAKEKKKKDNSLFIILGSRNDFRFSKRREGKRRSKA